MLSLYLECETVVAVFLIFLPDSQVGLSLIDHNDKIQPSHKQPLTVFRRQMRTLTHTTSANPSKIFLSLMRLVDSEHLITLKHLAAHLVRLPAQI